MSDLIVIPSSVPWILLVSLAIAAGLWAAASRLGEVGTKPMVSPIESPETSGRRKREK